MPLRISRRSNPPTKSKTALGITENHNKVYPKVGGGLDITGLIWHVEDKADEREGPFSRGISKIPDADIVRDSTGIIGLRAHTFQDRAAQPYPFFFIAKLVGTLTREAYVDWQVTWSGTHWPASNFDYAKQGRDFTVLYTDDYPSGTGPADVMFDPEQAAHRQAGMYVRGWNGNAKTGARPPYVDIRNFTVSVPEDFDNDWDKYKYGGSHGPHRDSAPLDCDNLQPPQVKAHSRYAFVTFRRFEPQMLARRYDPSAITSHWDATVAESVLWPRVWASLGGIGTEFGGGPSLPFTPWSVKDRLIVPDWPRPLGNSLSLRNAPEMPDNVEDPGFWHLYLPSPIGADYKTGNEMLIEPGILRVTAYVYDELGGNLVFAKTITLIISNDGTRPWWQTPSTGVDNETDILYSCTPNYCASIPPEPGAACVNDLAFYNTDTGAENYDAYVPSLDNRDTSGVAVAVYDLSGLINTQNAGDLVEQQGFSIARMCDDIPAEKDLSTKFYADIWAWHEHVGFSPMVERPILNCTFNFVDAVEGFSYGTDAVEFIVNDGPLDPEIDPPTTKFMLTRPPFEDIGDGEDVFPPGTMSMATETSPRIYIVSEPSSNWLPLPINARIAIYANPWSDDGVYFQMSVTRNSVCQLQDGRIAFLCGINIDNQRFLALYDPSPPDINDRWSPGALLALGRVYAAATVMTNGRILVTGGRGSAGSFFYQDTALYNPTADSWLTGPMMPDPYFNHSAVSLNNGQVLVCCGRKSATAGDYNTNCTRYNPGSNTFVPTAVLPTGAEREDHISLLLLDGTVLIAGGYKDSTVISSVYTYSSGTDSWTGKSSMPDPVCYAPAVLLADGRVFVAGGSLDKIAVTSNSYIYDPTSDTWTSAAAMSKARAHHTLTALASGLVLAVGGQSTVGDFGSDKFDDAELYDPATDTWTTQYMGRMNKARSYHCAVQQSDGNVLIVGDHTDASSYEIYAGQGTA